MRRSGARSSDRTRSVETRETDPRGNDETICPTSGPTPEATTDPLGLLRQIAPLRDETSPLPTGPATSPFSPGPSHPPRIPAAPFPRDKEEAHGFAPMQDVSTSLRPRPRPPFSDLAVPQRRCGPTPTSAAAEDKSSSRASETSREFPAFSKTAPWRTTFFAWRSPRSGRRARARCRETSFRSFPPHTRVAGRVFRRAARRAVHSLTLESRQPHDASPSTTPESSLSRGSRGPRIFKGAPTRRAAWIKSV